MTDFKPIIGKPAYETCVLLVGDLDKASVHTFLTWFNYFDEFRRFAELNKDSEEAIELKELFNDFSKWVQSLVEKRYGDNSKYVIHRFLEPLNLN